MKITYPSYRSQQQRTYTEICVQTTGYTSIFVYTEDM